LQGDWSSDVCSSDLAQAGRMAKVKIKFNPVREVLVGKKVVVVDDSIVRGTTSKALVQLIRQAGAAEVHFRVASPPITGPCYYGRSEERRVGKECRRR